MTARALSTAHQTIGSTCVSPTIWKPCGLLVFLLPSNWKKHMHKSKWVWFPKKYRRQQVKNKNLKPPPSQPWTKVSDTSMPSPKLTVPPWKWAIPQKKSSSNHPFSSAWAVRFREGNYSKSHRCYQPRWNIPHTEKIFIHTFGPCRNTGFQTRKKSRQDRLTTGLFPS